MAGKPIEIYDYRTGGMKSIGAILLQCAKRINQAKAELEYAGGLVHWMRIELAEGEEERFGLVPSHQQEEETGKQMAEEWRSKHRTEEALNGR